MAKFGFGSRVWLGEPLENQDDGISNAPHLLGTDGPIEADVEIGCRVGQGTDTDTVDAGF